MEKHILIVTTTHDFLWKFERDNVDLLQRMGYVVHYAANLNEPAYRSDEARFQEMGVWAHHIDIARSPFLFAQNKRALRQLLWLVHRFRIQAIHCHTPVGGVLGRLAGRLCEGQRPVVMYTAHGFHFYKGAPVFNWLTYYQVERLLARDTDVLIVINEEDYQAARHFRLRKGGRLYKIPGVGLDTEVFRPLSETMRNDLRARLGLQTKDFFLVSVGELNENKNQVVVLKALEKLRQEEADGFSYRYGICGDGFLRKKWSDGLKNERCRIRLPCTAFVQTWRRSSAARMRRCSLPNEKGWAWLGWRHWPWGFPLLRRTTGERASTCRTEKTGLSVTAAMWTDL